MKPSEIRNLSAADLNKELSKSQAELVKSKLKTISKESKETHKVKSLRKHVARLQTAKVALSKAA